jgi:sugar (pentulose or hexulose) kinase
MGDLLCAIDCGTQSLRMILFDPQGRRVAAEKIEYPPYHSPRPGRAEQDPERLWGALRHAGRRIFDGKPELSRRVAAVGVTGQRNTMICLDHSGAVLRPAITWLDTRKARNRYRPDPLHRLCYRLTGMAEALRKTEADGKSNWIREQQPEIWERTWKYVQVSGFLIHRLTGEAADSVASMVGHLPMDYRRRCWAGEGDLKSKLFPLEEEKRSRLLEPGELLGRVHTAAAELTGIPAGTPVIACGSDKACETLGMGVTEAGIASLSFGTTATVEVASRRYFSPQRFMPAYCAAVPGRYNPEIEIYRGYWMVSWFKKELGHRELAEAQRTGVLPEELLSRLLDSSPPGNRGLMLQPYWGPGLKMPHARGAIVGFGDVHDRPALFRAIVEGLAYALREGLETLERRGGMRVEHVVAGGGASSSDRICSVTADILDRPILRGENWETSALGAAVATAVGSGLHADFDTAIGEMVRMRDAFAPRREHRALYDELYRLYRGLYPRLEGIYRKMRRSTGYPEWADTAG